MSDPATGDGWLAGWLGPRWAALLLLIVVLPLPWASPSLRLALENIVFDGYQTLYPRVVETYPVAIVDIDQASIDAIGQWPWPRTVLATLIEKTAAAGALAIGLDILMPEADRYNPAQLVARHPGLDVETRGRLEALTSNDDEFAQRIFALPVVVARAGENDANATKPAMPTTVRIKGPRPHEKLMSFTGYLANVVSIEDAAQGHGFLNSAPGADGAFRFVPAVIQVAGEVYPTLSVEVLRLALGQQSVTLETDARGVRGLRIGDSFLPLDRDGRVRLHFSGIKPKRRVSALDLLQGKLDKGVFASNVVLMGATALGLRDAPPTPVTGRMDGIEIQAQMIETLLSNSRLLRPDWTMTAEIALVVLLGGILVLAGRDARPSHLALLFLVPGTAAAVASFFLFMQQRLLLDPSPALLAGAVICAVLLAWGYTHANRRLHAEQVNRARVEGEIDAARKIQRGIMPDPKNIKGLPGNVEFFALLEPTAEVGGDLYDGFMVNETQFFFMIGDVSGKGLGASVFMTISKVLCKSAALRGITDLEEMVFVANNEIARDNTEEMFVTAVVGLFGTSTGRLQLCNAGHDAPLLKSPGGEVRPLDTEGGLPLSSWEDFPYTAEEVQLQPGEFFILYTDGVSEAHGPDNVQFGVQRITAYLEQCEPDADMETVTNGLHRAVADFMTGRPQFDDIAIVALRYLGREQQG